MSDSSWIDNPKNTAEMDQQVITNWSDPASVEAFYRRRAEAEASGAAPEPTPWFDVVVNYDQGEWKLLQVVEEPGHGEGMAGYFFFLRAANAIDMMGPTGRRDVMGGPLLYRGKWYSQHAPGGNSFD